MNAAIGGIIGMEMMMEKSDGRLSKADRAVVNEAASASSPKASIPDAESLRNAMFDRSVRMHAMWPFPQHEPGDEYLEAFEYSEDDLPEPIAALVCKWSEEDRGALFAGSGWDAREAHSELGSDAYRKGLHGFIGVAESPVRTPTSATSASLSWGHYRTKLLFAETADELLFAACEWADEQRKADMAGWKPSDQSLKGEDA